MNRFIFIGILLLHATFGVQSALAQENVTDDTVTTLNAVTAAEDATNVEVENVEDVENHNETLLEMQTETNAETVVQTTISDKRLGFVNFRRIMSTIPQLAGIRDALSQEFSGQQKALEEAKSELLALEQQANANSNAPEYESIAQQLIAKRRDVARQEAAFRDDYSVRRNEEIAKLQKQVLDEIIALAKEQGYDVILNDNGVLYVSEEADLTQVVINRLLEKTSEAGDK